MCVGEKIKSYLENNGITQTFVANKTGIPVQKLNLSLNGNRRLDFDEYELICGALSVGTDKFLEPKLPEVKQKGVYEDGRRINRRTYRLCFRDAWI